VRMLGFASGTFAFEHTFRADPLMGPMIESQAGLRIPLTPDPWEALAWAIMGQQINLRFAVALRRELILTAGKPHASGLRAHPSATEVASLDVDKLRGMKFSTSKAEYLLTAARSAAPLEHMRETAADAAAHTLSAIRGVGPWTVQYVLLRGLGFADCLPAGDAGLAQGLHRLTGARPSEAQIRSALDRFAPYRSLATCHIWASLSSAIKLPPAVA